MTVFNWEELLIRWSRDIIELNAIIEENPPETVPSEWIGYPSATEAQITAAESRLGTILSPSYRSFLKVTNGWPMTTPFIDTLWSTEYIEWFAARHQHDWINPSLEEARRLNLRSITDEEYFVYGDDQNPGLIRYEYLQTALEISDVGDSAIYLLNPQVITPEGEWEAWFLASWLPGANRYQSFWKMMQAEYIRFLRYRDRKLKKEG